MPEIESVLWIYLLHAVQSRVEGGERYNGSLAVYAKPGGREVTSHSDDPGRIRDAKTAIGGQLRDQLTMAWDERRMLARAAEHMHHSLDQGVQGTACAAVALPL